MLSKEEVLSSAWEELAVFMDEVMLKLNLERGVEVHQVYRGRIQNGRDTKERKSTLDKGHSLLLGVNTVESMAHSENDSLAQVERTRAIVGEVGKVSKGSHRRGSFTPHLGICNACCRHDFIHTTNGEVV